MLTRNQATINKVGHFILEHGRQNACLSGLNIEAKPVHSRGIKDCVVDIFREKSLRFSLPSDVVATEKKVGQLNTDLRFGSAQHVIFKEFLHVFRTITGGQTNDRA